MATKWSEEKISRWMKEGRGQGEGPNYEPWLAVQDVLGNQGRCHRIPSPKLGRHVELMSDVERAAFLIVERSRWVTEAKEQYPLPRKLSQAVAQAMGIRHPTYPGTNIPCVMTVDLMVTLRRPPVTLKLGIDCKTQDKAEDPNVIRKLELMRRCLATLGHEHVLFFDTHIPKQIVRNLLWIISGRRHPNEELPYPDYLDEARERLYSHLSSTLFGDRPLRMVCQEFDDTSGQQPGTSLRAAKLLIDSYRLHVDLNGPDLPGRPLNDFSLECAATEALRVAL